MLKELSKLRFVRLRFRLRAETALHLPPYKGSTLRGGFGLAFKDAVCIVEHRACERCILQPKCAYPYVFETPVPNGSRRMASLEHAPHPFVIESPLADQTRYAIGDALDFGLVLIGRGIDYLPYFIFAFEHLGQRRGIGKGIATETGIERGSVCDHDSRARTRARITRGRFSVEAVAALNASGEAQVYDGRSKALRGDLHAQTIRDLASTPAFDFQLSTSGSPACHLPLSHLKLDFETPTRLIFDRRLAPVPEFHIVVRNLLRRLSNLTYFHCGAQLDLDFRGLVDAATQVKLVDNRTRWHDWQRYSARQDKKLMMGGVVGEAVYEGNIESLVPLLALGEVLHVGKGTGFGLGRYRWKRDSGSDREGCNGREGLE